MTLEWCTQRGLGPLRDKVGLPQSALSSGIREDLERTQTEGFVFEKKVEESKDITVWFWYEPELGIGIVIPTKIGGLVIKWSSVESLLKIWQWIGSHPK